MNYYKAFKKLRKSYNAAGWKERLHARQAVGLHALDYATAGSIGKLESAYRKRKQDDTNRLYVKTGKLHRHSGNRGYTKGYLDYRRFKRRNAKAFTHRRIIPNMPRRAPLRQYRTTQSYTADKSRKYSALNSVKRQDIFTFKRKTKQKPYPGKGQEIGEATKLSDKRFCKLPQKQKKKPRSITPYDFMQNICPLVKWSTKSILYNYESTVGRQGILGGTNSKNISNWWTILSQHDLQRIYEKLVIDIANNTNFSAITLSAGNLPGNASHGTNPTNYPDLICQGYTRNYQFSNNCNSVAYIEIWETVAKEDIKELTTGTSANLINCWSEDIEEAAIAGQGWGKRGLNQLISNTIVPTVDLTITTDLPGVRPELRGNSFLPKSNLANNYKLMRVTKYKIGPFGKQYHTIRIPGFRLTFDQIYQGAAGSIGFLIPEISHQCMLIAIGERCYDGATTTHTSPSYAATYGNVQYNEHMAFRIAPRANKKFQFMTAPLTHYVEGQTVVDIDATYAYPIAVDPCIIDPSGDVPVAKRAGINFDTVNTTEPTTIQTTS